MPAWLFQGVDAAIGSNKADDAFDSSSVTGNVDGSVLERLEALQQRIPQLATKTFTFTAAAFEVSTAVTMFTVSGDVMARAWGRVGTAVEADAGNDGTLSLGVEDDVDILLPVTTANETNFAANDVWTDNGTQQGDAVAAADWVVIANSEPIELNVLVEDITAGSMTIYCEWMPLSSGATVTAA